MSENTPSLDASFLPSNEENSGDEKEPQNSSVPEEKGSDQPLDLQYEDEPATEQESDDKNRFVEFYVRTALLSRPLSFGLKTRSIKQEYPIHTTRYGCPLSRTINQASAILFGH